MARGQVQAADNQLDLTNSIGGEYNGQAEELQGKLIPGYTSLMNTGYLSPEEETAATTSEMGSATAPFASAGFQASNRAGATRNASDLTAQQDQLALEEGQTAGQAADVLQGQKMHNQEEGMAGLSGLEGEDLEAMEKMYGLGPGTLQARAAGESGDQLLAGYGNMAANLYKAFNPNQGGGGGNG
jgi:hypothetical protein